MHYQIETENSFVSTFLVFLHKIGAIRIQETSKKESLESDVPITEIVESVKNGYQEMRKHQKAGTKPKSGAEFLAEMGKEFSE
ncbi:MAG: hypothetical protein ACKVTZ_01735 [Bacteroidia bacterium]